MRAKGRKQGRFVALGGLKKLSPPPGSSYPLLIIDSTGQPVFFLCEWYRLQKERDPGRTPDTYLDMALPWAGFLLRRGFAWNDSPDRVLSYLIEFFRDDVACLVSSDSKREDGLCVDTTGSSPLSKSSLGVLLAALTSLYDTLIAAGYYAYQNPLRSERMIALKREHVRQVKNAGAPDHAGTRGESWAETNRAFPTNKFRQRRGKVWEPQVVLEPDVVQKRMRKVIDIMVQHATFLRDQVILLLLRQTGARISEIIEMTVGGYRNAHHAGRALVKNKGGHGCEEKLIHFTPTIEHLLHNYILTERARYDPRSRKQLDKLDDNEPLFLTRTGKPYSRSAFYHHWNRLFALAQSQLKKEEKKEVVEFTPHDLRHLRVTRTVTNIREDANGNSSKEAAGMEGFQHLMAWRSPETMQTYIKTMNKRQAIKAVLDDEEAQEQVAANAQVAYLKRTEARSPGNTATEAVSSQDDSDEFDWYTH